MKIQKRDFVHTSDFSKEDYEEVLRRIAIFEEGVRAGKDFTHLLSGKVLASMFLKESTRTMTAFQSAIVRLGGGWTGLTGTSGTYIATGEEDIADIVKSIAEVSDIMALRYNDCDPRELADMIDIPLINGMCGGDEHAAGVFVQMYPYMKRLKTFEGKKIGLYGMVSASRPIKAFLSAASLFNVTFVIDPVVDVFKTPEHIAQIVEKNGSKIEYAPVDEWLPEVDAFTWLEGLPQAGEPQEHVDRFNENFHQFVAEDLKRIKDDAVFMGITPRMTTTGIPTVAKEVDLEPRNVTFEALENFQYVCMGLMTFLLDVEIS